MNKAIVIGRFIVTTVRQGLGAPIFDGCAGHTAENRSWRGFAIHLKPWKKNRYGDREVARALCIGMIR